MRAWLRAWVPARLAIDARERTRAAAGVLVGLLFTALLSWLYQGWSGTTIWLAAPLGASAVLVFVAPASPLAQPWAVIGGNTLCALTGMACWALLPVVQIAGPLAAALGTAAMMALRCLHPPGGAVALLAVLVAAGGGRLGAEVVLLNSVLMVAAGLLYNPLTGRAYPHPQREGAAPKPGAGARFSTADLDAVLARYNQLLDVSRDDLEGLLLAAELEGYRRRVGPILCRDVMTGSVTTVRPDTPLPEAWALMGERQVKALPVVDAAGVIAGILTRGDLLRSDRGYPGEQGAAAATRVRERMSVQVRVAGEDDPAVALLPLFAEAGHHHIPVVNGARQVVGIITESDFVRALYRLPEQPPAG